MSDSIKAQKLAAARKKLKEFQQKNVKSSKDATTPQEVLSAADSMASSTHSLENLQNPVSYFTEPPTSQIQNYFNAGNVENVPVVQQNFFDTCTKNNQEALFSNNENMTLGGDTCQNTKDNDINSRFFSYEIQDADAVAEHDPELKFNEVFDKLNSVTNTQTDILNNLVAYAANTQDIYNSGNKVTGEIFNDFTNNSITNPPATGNSNFSSNVNEVSPDYENIVEPVYSNLESLNQLSSQIHQAVADYDTYDLKHNNELERRNQELAGLLEKERLKCQELNIELSKERAERESEKIDFNKVKNELESKLSGELGPLQEQLQYHMQTVGILVAEKTELTASLSQSKILEKQKASECEELQGRLKASRSRAADLEKELNNLKAEKSKFEQIGSQNNEISAKYQSDVKRFELEKEELAQDLSELREKFNISAGENLKLQHEIQELNAQLSLATVKIQQLSNGESVQNENQFEELIQQKLLLEKQITELQNSVKTVTNERDQASVQYQQYTQQLNTQLSNIAAKLETTTQQNESLLKREQELVQHIGELEKHLQSLQSDHVNFTTYKNNNGLKKELEDSTEQLNELKRQHEMVVNSLETFRTENEDLLKDLATKKDIIAEMEGKIERLEGNQPDSAKLLAAMESDKVAAARAVHQNTQLKKQLEDMEEVFIKMSNDKLELTEQLTSAQHQIKELTEKLNQTEHHLKTLTEAIEIKDRELTNIREGTTELNKQVLQQNQLADRLRHYEAQENSAGILQNQLQEALLKIEELKDKNVELFNQLGAINNQRVMESSRLTSSFSQTTSECPIQVPAVQETATGSESLDQPELSTLLLENEALKNVILELEGSNKSLNERIELLSVSKMVNQTDYDKENGLVDNFSSLNREDAMKQLELKFKKTMDDIAELQEEKQRLEHVVLQLQGETETIGEYIALYRHQRGVLNQRTVEKENQLKKIAGDREEMRAKLDQLNSLIKRLILENGTLPTDILEEHKIINEEARTHIDDDPAEEAKEKITNGFTSEKNKTAQKIIDLLSEIKTQNLVSQNENFENVHCPCCSGHLITV